jgi:hypothetical protein
MRELRAIKVLYHGGAFEIPHTLSHKGEITPLY